MSTKVQQSEFLRNLAAVDINEDGIHLTFADVDREPETDKSPQERAAETAPITGLGVGHDYDPSRVAAITNALVNDGMITHEQAGLLHGALGNRELAGAYMQEALARAPRTVEQAHVAGVGDTPQPERRVEDARILGEHTNRAVNEDPASRQQGI